MLVLNIQGEIIIDVAENVVDAEITNKDSKERLETAKWKLLHSKRGKSRGYGQKQELEKRFQNWANEDPERKEKYGNILENYKEAYEEMGKDFKKLIYTAIAANGAEILGYARGYGQLAELLEQKTDEVFLL